MTTSQQKQLSDWISTTAAGKREAGEAVTMDAIKESIKANMPGLWKEAMPMLAEIGFGEYARRALKSAPLSNAADVRQLCLDFGLHISVSEMVAVPDSLEAPLGKRAWKYLGDCTVSDLRSAIAHLVEQAQNDSKRAKGLRQLMHRVSRIIGSDSPLTVADAAVLAREKRERAAGAEA